MKLTSSHPAGLESLQEIASRVSLKVSALHNHFGTLSVLFASQPGKYEMETCEHLWRDGPVNIHLGDMALDIEDERVENPFLNGAG